VVHFVGSRTPDRSKVKPGLVRKDIRSSGSDNLQQGQNNDAQGGFSANVEVPIVLNDSQKTQFSNEWRTYRERNANLIKHRGHAFSLIQGQCTQLLQYRMKQYMDWAVVSTSYEPLTLYHLIERTILAQTEDQYPFATMYDQELSFYSFKQEILSNPQWYERFNTKVDVSEAIGLTRQHKVILNYVAQASYTKSFVGLGVTEQKLVRDGRGTVCLVCFPATKRNKAWKSQSGSSE
jgi:hypothetical protein